VDLVFNDLAPTNGIIETRFTASPLDDAGMNERGEAFVQALEIGPGNGGKGARPVSFIATPTTGNLLFNPGFEDTVIHCH
jgi:hypothetical protein